ncbi:DNA adenine methylase [Calothrix sp. 336/3]|uniref:DNA adenine methylase n=1 Tax=Calothrix sp. 336/3 TaxID=1337936 RepID=UPI0004E2EF12|nr:DNA adenine methylase [Calothrix sp. 336/3]AKG21685.1 modification methylase [Calothrix sp. 336/3]
MIKSPLRYPGGKSKAISQIAQYIPDEYSEFREPFVGGGSVFIYVKQKFPHTKIWINDLNQELFLFWKYSQSHLSQLVGEIRKIKGTYKNGKLLFEELIHTDVDKISDFDRAVRFFILNRITFSGTVESGGFSEQAFHKRFTYSSIDRLEKLETILTADIKITNLDYSQLLQTQGKNVFIFLDPPYFTATKSKLYGKNGDLHTCFNHHQFASLLQDCQHKWLITYDDSPYIRDNFPSANIREWQLQYGMNNYKQGNAAKGKELFISNYEIRDNFKINADGDETRQAALQLSLEFY